MPIPRGWTAEDERLRDECVEALLREGVPRGRTPEEQKRSPRARAYAICTAMVHRHKRSPAPPEVVMAAARKAWLALWG